MIETERLSLSPVTLDDAELILAVLTDPDFVRWVGDRKVRTIAECRDYLARGPVTTFGETGLGLFVVRLRDSGEAIGICSLLQRDELLHVDLGFATLPAHRGRGLTREAALATIADARDRLALEHLAAITDPGNLASIGLLEGLGFVAAGTVLFGPDKNCLRLFELKI